jgi:hypothetical protein
VIDGFLGIEDTLQDILLERYANPHESETCRCGGGQRLVHCRNCFRYETSCALCFAKAHHHLPFHWAFIWDSGKGHFIKHDYSSLSEDCAIQLGDHIHGAAPCDPTRSATLFTIVHSNGIHATRIRFCRCPGAPDKVTQLMRSQLFPGTHQDPKTGFTFEVLKQFHMHNLQSKCGAFDFILSLRRLTDNVFTARVPVSPFRLHQP